MGPKYTMIIDLQRCVGCGACEVACRKEHSLPIDLGWTRVGRIHPQVQNRGLTRRSVPMICMQCEDAPCVDVCPTKASIKRNDGIVEVDPKKCMGCRYCMAVCPYGARKFNEDLGIVQKCNFCLARLEKGMVPRCVETCHMHARYFGDPDDPESEVSKISKRHKAEPLAPEMKTNPTCQYVLEW